MKKIYLALVLVVFVGLRALAQNDNGAIKVKLEDKDTKESIPFANVAAYRDGILIGVATTNMDGEAYIKPLSPGKYTVKGNYVGYQPMEIQDVLVGEGKTAYVNMGLGTGTLMDEVVIGIYLNPLIDPDTKSGQTVTREDYQHLAIKDPNGVAATTAGVYQADEGKGLNVRGGREGNTTYFVDGVKVFGTPNLPQQSIEQLNIITGGVPANYGDLASGAVSISTRGPQPKYFGGIELISSQLTDPYGYNSLGFSFGGPLYKKRDSTRRTVLGFFISGQGNYVKEPSPSFVPIYVINEDKLQEIKNQPLMPSPSGTGFIRSSEFVTKNDMHTQRYRPNAAARLLTVNGKIDFAPTVNTNISLGGFYEYTDNMNANQVSTLMNSENHSRTQQGNWRTSLSITQKFGNATTDKSKTQSVLKNSFFRFQASYDNLQNKTQDIRHKMDYFNYGHVGKFDRTFLDESNAFNYQFTPAYFNGTTTVNSYTYTGRRELPVNFTPGTLNPDAALYTNYLIANSDPRFVYMGYIQGNNGLVNGDSPESIYSLFLNFGTYPTTPTRQMREQYRMTASFNTDIKDHALTVGMEFDQRTSSFYAVGASSLWTRMRLITNAHTTQLNTADRRINQELSGLVDYYYFPYLYEGDKQTQFSERLLDKLGLPNDYTGFVNTDALDPSLLSMDMFSAEDLLGQQRTTNLVNYNGYTHDGKRDKKKTSMTDFLEATDENGRHTYPIGSFRPLYTSAYIMDKFDFKDIKFLVGLRVDRYDANQPVLKDKYALAELATVGDLGSIENLPPGFTENIPGSISKDAAVYVAQNPSGGKQPLSITGFREGDKWFNAEGVEISDPGLIVASDSRPVPLFKDFADYEKPVSASAFTNYKASIHPQPRLAFSFPISDVSNFFAHYDVLIQRPNSNINTISPLDYLFLESASNAPVIANPDLKPQQSIDYELGFSQVLNERKNASLEISTFYKEMRNLINLRTIVGAYPKNYIMYDNIDFATTKGLSLKFDFRRTGGSRINFNYTLQFAEGSGSNVNSGANLATSGQPNLRVLQPLDFDQRHTFVLIYDYRFGSKKEYKGPTFKRKDKQGNDKIVHVFEDVGFNISGNLGSGTPYTRWNTAVPLNGGGRSSIIGQINGSSKPWGFRANLRIDKNIALEWGREESPTKKKANLNVYLLVLNLFNNQNVINVYNYTGSPDDDGYLTSTQAQAQLVTTNSPQAFTDMYTIRMNAPTNYSLPRQIRIGVLFDF